MLGNLAVLDHDPATIDGIILSHGHYDHCGGLLSLLQAIGARPVYAHPGLFRERYWQGQHEQRAISIPASREELAAAGADFVFHPGLTELAPGLFLSGGIPRLNPYETGDPHLVERVAGLAETHPDTLAFSLMMIRLNACLGCVSGSYRFMRGCELCSQQTIARFQGTDEELIALFEQAQEDLKRSQESGADLSADVPEPEVPEE